ncbi:MAG TPA: CaiB/BaiF CoA-transferase family protein [Chondromyces sp.]|nr:CaiB/BaiF CoA-transferase family protein [Chondromyces sp.]
MLVLDLSRMLPGAVLARQLLDLGARLIKVEEPGIGDPMRMVPPLLDGIGVGFAAFLRGAESIVLDLRENEDAARLRRLAARADVLVESFRPGTMEQWAIGWDDLRELNPRLVWCSLPSFGSAPAVRDLVAHDLNLSAMAGILDLVGGRVPRLQLADVTSGLLASSSILAALLARERGGSGGRIEQPLAAGPLPFLTWSWLERAAGGGGVLDTLLGGSCPCYRIYRCGDGRELSLAALEPKFWAAFVELIGAEGLVGAAFALGEDGARAAAAVERALAAHPREHWLRLAAEAALPVGPVHGLDEAMAEPLFAAAELCEDTPLPGGGTAPGVGPWNAGVGRTPDRPAPRVGEHTAAILAEFGIRN